MCAWHVCEGASAAGCFLNLVASFGTRCLNMFDCSWKRHFLGRKFVMWDLLYSYICFVVDASDLALVAQRVAFILLPADLCG